MIGGIDVRIPSGAGPQSIEVAVRAIRQAWPGAVFENGNTAERYPFFRQIPFGAVDELFVYRDYVKGYNRNPMFSQTVEFFWNITK